MVEKYRSTDEARASGLESHRTGSRDLSASAHKGVHSDREINDGRLVGVNSTHEDHAKGGGGAYSFIACLSHSTIDHESLSRRSTVLTPTRDTSNIGALITYITQQFLAYLIGGLNGIAQGAPRGHGIDDKGVRRLFQRPCLVVPRLGRNLSSVKQAARNGVVSILDMNNLRLQANKFAFPLQEMGHDLCTFFAASRRRQQRTGAGIAGSG